MERDNRGTRLKKSADADKVEPFCVMQGDGTFNGVADFYARLSVVDRFLSNFHKPLQRRMLFTDPSTPLPANGVIQHCITKDIYIVGQQRLDADGQASYERLNVVHLVSNESSTFAEVFKWARPDGAAPESMLLERKSIGKFYISLEYQSSSTERYSDKEQSSRMLFYAPAELLDQANELCEFTYNNKDWSLKQVFFDSGYASGTLIDTGQNIDNFKLIKPVNTYDPTSGSWDFMAGAAELPFSASWGEDDGDMSLSGRYGVSNSQILYVKAQFQYASNFKTGGIVQSSDGRTWRINAIRNNRRSPDLQLTLSKLAKPQPMARPEN